MNRKKVSRKKSEVDDYFGVTMDYKIKVVAIAEYFHLSTSTVDRWLIQKKLKSRRIRDVLDMIVMKYEQKIADLQKIVKNQQIGEVIKSRQEAIKKIWFENQGG